MDMNIQTKYGYNHEPVQVASASYAYESTL